MNIDVENGLSLALTDTRERMTDKRQCSALQYAGGHASDMH